ncbi:MAG: hypothetical protein M1822_008874 [Bathelium mastoideum]|nr:MAG: hypothetical protein M1822_008874 [Bathelium mastoideum]
MRLLNIRKREFEDKEGSDLDTALQKCAIISHRWGDNETNFQNLQEILQLQESPNSTESIFDDPESYKFSKEEEGLFKIAVACKKASEYGFRGEDGRGTRQTQAMLEYIWMDTCCIDKTNSDEEDRAINSMFRWYRDAKVCFAYLSDVSQEESEYQDEQKDLKGKRIQRRINCFKESDWFSRGWTLQELLAPRVLYFFDHKWRFIDAKKTRSADIQSRTKIEAKYINGDFSDACTAVKMSWLSSRETTLKEDMAYCMVGIFGVYMHVQKAEGEHAFLRLQEELIKQKAADESLFAWRNELVTSCGLLAPWPTCFKKSERLTIHSRRYSKRKPYTVVGGGIEFHAPNVLPENGNATEWMAITAAVRRNYQLKLEASGEELTVMTGPIDGFPEAALQCLGQRPGQWKYLKELAKKMTGGLIWQEKKENFARTPSPEPRPQRCQDSSSKLHERQALSSSKPQKQTRSAKSDVKSRSAAPSG